MRRYLIFVTTFLAFFSSMSVLGWLPVAWGSTLIPQPEAARHGLKRAWHLQIEVDASRNRLQHITLSRGMFFVQTDGAMIHAIDAETGHVLWNRQVGEPRRPTLPLGANHDLVAVTNGSTLFVLNRYNGYLLWKTSLGGVPGAGPAVNNNRVYVPMVDGMILAFRMVPVEKETADPIDKITKTQPREPTPAERLRAELTRREDLALQQDGIQTLHCQSFGRSLVQPTITVVNDHLARMVWTTDKGSLFIGQIDLAKDDRFTIKHQVAIGSETGASVTYLPPIDPKVPGDTGVVLFGARDGSVRALSEKTGESFWQFPTGDSVLQPVAAIGNRAYAATQLGGMYCLDVSNGQRQWWAPGINQFVAASPERIYAADRLGQLQILHAKTGARLDTLPVPPTSMKLTNMETDRIYLVTERGLVQCFHEMELPKPIEYRQKASAPAKSEKKAKSPAETAPEAPATTPATPKPNPFGDAGGGDNPFGE